MKKPLPPGTVLQLMYLRERLKKLPIGRFVEIGPGSGEITNLLLELGWDGIVYDLEDKTIENLKVRFSKAVAKGRLAICLGDYLSSSENNADLVISCMVMEHLDDKNQKGFMEKSAVVLCKGGNMIGLVPSSPDHWGIEDEIAGHYRRYTKKTISDLMSATGWRLLHCRGLTFPVSNLLLPISNFLVKRKERQKLMLSKLERTKQSGRRKVLFKTSFPSVFLLLLNRVVLYPFHILQKVFGDNDNALVLYFEAEYALTSKDGCE